MARDTTATDPTVNAPVDPPADELDEVNDDFEAPQPEPTYTETGHVWIHNPATDGTWACPVDVVGLYLGRGWTYTTAPDEDESHLSDPTPPTDPDPVDPTQGADSNTGD